MDSFKDLSREEKLKLLESCCTPSCLPNIDFCGGCGKFYIISQPEGEICEGCSVVYCEECEYSYFSEAYSEDCKCEDGFCFYDGDTRSKCEDSVCDICRGKVKANLKRAL